MARFRPLCIALVALFASVAHGFNVPLTLGAGRSPLEPGLAHHAKGLRGLGRPAVRGMGRCGPSSSPLLFRMTTTEQPEVVEREETSNRIGSTTRFLGSRRLAAASKVIVEGGEKGRVREAAKILIKTPKDPKRILGSKRLRAARDILFSGVNVHEDKKMFGSRRLASARKVLVGGVPKPKLEVLRKPVKSDEPAEAAAPAAVQATAVAAEEDAPFDMLAPREGPLQFAGIIATDEQVREVERIRRQIAEIPKEERAKMTDWVDTLFDEDILRYIIQFKQSAFQRIKETAVFRAEEGIDNILETDADKFERYFDAGQEEIVYLAPDKRNRPILLYRSAYHWPGVQDPKEYTRYILYQTEKTRQRYGLGITRQSCVIVERVGSGHKNQDPALLKVLLPTVLNHYPMYIGDVYIAPISTVFFVVWKLIQFFLDDATKKRFHLLKGDYTAQLLEVIEADSLPSTLGGTLDVGDFCAKQRELDRVDASLGKLEDQMLQTNGAAGALTFGGKAATPDQIVAVAELRVNIASLTDADKEEFGPWLPTLDNVDLFRFLTVNGFSAERAWAHLMETSRWRKEEGIDSILDEDLSGVFEEGKQEVFTLPKDKLGRPIVVYRSALHVPGKIDVKTFVRFVVQQVESARGDYGLGLTSQASFIVDRVGSGTKNQDVALLRELVPVLQRHYPQTIDKIYIAPVNTVFFIIWTVAKLLFDQDTQERVVLVKEPISPELLKVTQPEVLPKNLGGDRLVPNSGVV